MQQGHIVRVQFDRVTAIGHGRGRDRRQLHTGGLRGCPGIARRHGRTITGRSGLGCISCRSLGCCFCRGLGRRLFRGSGRGASCVSIRGCLLSRYGCCRLPRGARFCGMWRLRAKPPIPIGDTCKHKDGSHENDKDGNHGKRAKLFYPVNDRGARRLASLPRPVLGFRRYPRLFNRLDLLFDTLGDGHEALRQLRGIKLIQRQARCRTDCPAQRGIAIIHQVFQQHRHAARHAPGLAITRGVRHPQDEQRRAMVAPAPQQEGQFDIPAKGRVHIGLRKDDDRRPAFPHLLRQLGREMLAKPGAGAPGGKIPQFVRFFGFAAQQIAMAEDIADEVLRMIHPHTVTVRIRNHHDGPSAGNPLLEQTALVKPFLSRGGAGERRQWRVIYQDAGSS